MFKSYSKSNTNRKFGVTMHIPDGYLDPIMVAATYLISIIGGLIILKTGKGLHEEETTQVTLMAAAIFVAQMLNWPIPGGTSAHFVGGALAAILFGPQKAFIIMFLVLFAQMVIFHDGGVTAFGANLFNMGIVDVLIGYYVFRLLARNNASEALKYIGAFLGSWLGITLAGIACGVEIGLSTLFIYGVVTAVLIMGFYHAILGVIEGVITVIVYRYFTSYYREGG